MSEPGSVETDRLPVPPRAECSRDDIGDIGGIGACARTVPRAAKERSAAMARRQRGQAFAEYAVGLAIIAVVLVPAGAFAGVPTADSSGR